LTETAAWPDSFRPSSRYLILNPKDGEPRDRRGALILRDAMPRHHTKSSAPGGSQRQLRVGETVRHAVADILSQGNVHDPDLEGHIITVPEVRMSPDLKLATVYVMPLGGRDTDVVLAALERNKKFLRGEIAHRVNLKFAPDLRFRTDERFDEAERIEKLLRTPAVQRDLAPDSDDE
jgi:ribosome-binding factor A